MEYRQLGNSGGAYRPLVWARTSSAAVDQAGVNNIIDAALTSA